MKNILFPSLLVAFGCLLSFSTSAQNAEEAAVLKMWNEVWALYEANDMDKIWAYYTDDAVEIYPDGSMIRGKEGIKAGYEQFSTMLEGTPSWKASPPVVQFITRDVALLTSDVEADVKLKGGQQIGGKSTFALIVKKQNNKWVMVFDSQTPVMQMPEK